MNLGKPVSIVETDRLLLRPFTRADLPALFAYQSRPDVTRYLLWDARTEDQVREALEKKLNELGVKNGGIVDAPYGSGLSFRDPDNIPLEFFAPPGR